MAGEEFLPDPIPTVDAETHSPLWLLQPKKEPQLKDLNILGASVPNPQVNSMIENRNDILLFPVVSSHDTTFAPWALKQD